MYHLNLASRIHSTNVIMKNAGENACTLTSEILNLYGGTKHKE